MDDVGELGDGGAQGEVAQAAEEADELHGQRQHELLLLLYAAHHVVLVCALRGQSRQLVQRLAGLDGHVRDGEGVEGPDEHDELAPARRIGLENLHQRRDEALHEREHQARPRHLSQSA
ncbi:hypothetical protein Mapa_012846 [Marchantia paleacea]|nr:hypothetical protein Mapa_012846 [Marchantia paleacea]